MDVFKLAFETTVVGLLTFGWLSVATYLLFPDFRLDSIRQKFSDFVKDNPTAVGVGVLILAYCLRSAILPIANQLVNDEHWPLNENAILCQVFTRYQSQTECIHDAALPRDKGFSLIDLEPVHCSYWAPVFYPKGNEKNDLAIGRFLRLWFSLPAGKAGESSDTKTTGSDESKRTKILAHFQQQETVILMLGPDKTERIRQSHERIVVLRGLVFSLLILFLICLFAYFAKADGHPSHWFRPALGILLALGFTAFALLNGYQDLLHKNIFDISGSGKPAGSNQCLRSGCGV